VLVEVVLVAGEVTKMPTFTEWLNAPLVPVTCSVNEPVEDEEDALIVRVDVAGVPVDGVTGPGRAAVAPLGAEPTQE